MTAQHADAPQGDEAGSAGPSAADIELLSALNELHQGEIARRSARIALERAEDQVMRGIAIAMHEDIEHALATTRGQLHMLREQMSDEKDVKTMVRMEETLGRALTRMQRLVLEVRPPDLERAGIGNTLRSYLESVKNAYGLEYTLSNELHDDEPSLDVQITLFRVAQEAIDNTRKYANADSIEVSVRAYAGGFLLHVADDGTGFDADALEAERIGLISMRERAEVRDGWCQLVSTPGEGTAVDVWIPATSGYGESDGTATGTNDILIS